MCQDARRDGGADWKFEKRKTILLIFSVSYGFARGNQRAGTRTFRRSVNGYVRFRARRRHPRRPFERRNNQRPVGCRPRVVDNSAPVGRVTGC